MSNKLVAIVSGGLDSTAMVLKLRKQGYEVIPVNFHYGSKHNTRERQSAEAIFGSELRKIDIDLKHLTKSSLLNPDKAIAEGEYTEENARQTVVPFRNPLMLSYAVGIAEQEGAFAVALGNHSADHFIYPDCRPEFIEAFTKAVELGTDNQVTLISPFCEIDKAQIVLQTAIEDIETLYQTYSCYKGGPIHCGICSTCQERKRAFTQAGVEDKTVYEA